MKRFLPVLALSLLVGSPAAAQDPAAVQALDEYSSEFSLTSPDCGISLSAFEPDAQFCWGAYDGLNPYGGPGSTIITDWVVSEFGGGSLAGQTTGSGGTGVMSGFSGGPTGTISFSTALSGRYILALKAQTFGLFYFDFVTPVTSLTYSMAGASTTGKGVLQDLSNGSIWSVPEPGTILLLLTGLPALAVVGRRRRGGFGA